MTFCSRTFAATLLLVSCALTAEAQSTVDLERAKASFRAGAAAYAAGEYPAAIQALAQAYELTPLPAIAFSLGQAERRQFFADRDPHHLDRAIELFRRYVAQEPTGTRRADALDALAQLEPLAASAGVPLVVGDRVGAERTAAPTRIMVVSEAAQARAALDDSPPAPVPVVREVQPGPHRVVVEAPGYFPAERVITAVASELILSEVLLRERPSRLRIATSVDAELYLDGSFVSRGGSGVVLEQPSGRHTLTVAESGRRTEHHTLMLRRGETEQLEVLLRPSRQRLVSRGLFIGGATTAIGALVLAQLTLHEDRAASRFLSERRRGRAEAGDLKGYDESRRKRDSFRMASGLGLALAGALFCSAILTYVFDQPNPTAIQRSWSPGREVDTRESRVGPVLRVEPSVGVRSASVQLTSMF
ncbi:MAG: hypothetical protein RLZZ450_4904 [Pseudomonadota bacterium]|jgi:hypothetical protein